MKLATVENLVEKSILNWKKNLTTASNGDIDNGFISSIFVTVFLEKKDF